MLTLSLSELSIDQVIGIYTVGHELDRLPNRMRFLHPEAVSAFLKIASWAVVSDMFRSAEASFRAVRDRRGARTPGYSAHNYGLAIDIDIDRSRKRLANHLGQASISKMELDDLMRAAGWFCLRKDHTTAFEAWHFNFLGRGARLNPRFHSTANEIEEKIVELYGPAFELTDLECQTALQELGMYRGELDGHIGPLTREATRVFQRAWGVQALGVLNQKTRRTLAYVTARRDLVTASDALPELPQM